MPGIEATNSTIDRRLTAKPIWRRVALPGIAIALLLGVDAWAIFSTQAESVYRAPAYRLVIALVTKGPFEDFIEVRATVAPLTTASLATDQDRTVSD